ncbi:MAG TPA: dipeptidase [Novosphingobium sp.]|nr:dipeptidase [Novosphingobium sp.]
MNRRAMTAATLCPLAALILAAGTVAAARTPERTARAALKAAPVWDGHNDVPIQLRGRYLNVIGAFDFHDTHETGGDTGRAEVPTRPMHTDLARLKQGRVGAQFWSVYVAAALPEPEAVQATIEQIDVARRLIARYPNDMALALTAADVERAMKRGRVASLLGMEGGHSIGSSLAVLRQMHALGVRYMTLTHSKNTPWADSATDAPAHDGLTDFGRQVVREMNRLGMLVDLSHVSEQTMLDALDAAKAPAIFSHSGARAIDHHPRNVPDRVLARMRENGGIVMVVAYPSFVSEERRQWVASLEGETARAKALNPGDPDTVKAMVLAWREANPEPAVTIAQLADHIDHVRRVAGIDHIGLGGDYDGMETGPQGMEDVSGYPRLFEELARRGYSRADLEKIASRNMMRVMKAAEAYAAAHRGDPPIETPVKAEE